MSVIRSTNLELPMQNCIPCELNGEKTGQFISKIINRTCLLKDSYCQRQKTKWRLFFLYTYLTNLNIFIEEIMAKCSVEQIEMKLIRKRSVNCN